MIISTFVLSDNYKKREKKAVRTTQFVESTLSRKFLSQLIDYVDHEEEICLNVDAQ